MKIRRSCMVLAVPRARPRASAVRASAPGAALMALVLMTGVAGASSPARGAAAPDAEKQIRFGTEMAEQGNWREAMFRWRRALTSDPDNPRLHNNLAVAYESIGDYARADTEYRAALASPQAPDEVRKNYELFARFYERYKEG